MAKHLTDQAEKRLLSLRNEMLVTPEVCVQKAKYTTESFRRTEGAPIHYRRAMALDNVLTHLTVGIGDQELIVGRPTGKKRGGPLSPEVNSTWYTKEMDSFHTREQENYAEVSEEDKAIIRDCCEYWHGKSLFDRWQAAIPDELKFANGPIIGGGGFCLNTQYFGHISTDFEVVMQKGIRVIIDVKNTTIRKYKGANILKPNLQELSFLTKKPVKNIEEIIAASHYLCKKSCAEYVLTTCGSAGMVLVNPFGLIKYINSTRINAHDVTGAGDTAIAYFGAALANNIEVCNAMSIANIAAGIQVMKTGAAVITWQEVYEELIQLSEKNANRKILQVSDLSSLRELYSTKKIVFTNGCFDLLHIGHIHCLLSASNYGDILVVGINSDSSIKRIKGEERPVIPQNERVEILSALECVDYVILYEEDTPYNIISELQPDVLVKGGDYDATSIVGCDIVKKRGGEIQTVEIKHNTSSTKIIERILNQYKGKNNEPE